jgi:formylglycine-generating enzyme required for sulfatase activity
MERFLIITLVALFTSGGMAVAACPPADLTGDCYVDFQDYAVLASQWLTVYDVNDLAAMAGQWWTEGLPGMEWVSIYDSPFNFNGEMSKYETTNAQYCRFLNDALASGDIIVDDESYVVFGADGLTAYCNVGYDPDSGLYSRITYSNGTFSVVNHDGYDMGRHPVVEVSWYGAAAFCSYYGFRLPTESEWQAVADYDGTYTYGCGTTINPGKANYDQANPLGLIDWPYTNPVDFFPSYGYGLNDMAGNVFEWTSTSDGGYRVICGGSWYYAQSDCQVQASYSSLPNSVDNDLGFRVCR